MLTAIEVQNFLRQFEPLKEVVVEERSKLIQAPWLVNLSGTIMIYGEPFAFEAELDLKEFGSQDDLLKLAKQIMLTFAGASKHVQQH